MYLELRTDDARRARAFLGEVFGWRTETIRVDGRSFLAMDVGGRVEGGIAERDEGEPTWLPYVEVGDIGAVVGRAVALGATVIRSPREGPAGWHAIVDAPGGGRVGLWQPKR